MKKSKGIGKSGTGLARSVLRLASGAALLTIDASRGDPTPNVNNGDGHRIFNISNESPLEAFDVTITGLRLVGGDAVGDGGAIRAFQERLVLGGMELIDNSATGFGGAVSVRSSGQSAIASLPSSIASVSRVGDATDPASR